MMDHKTASYDFEASSYDESRYSSKIGQHIDDMHKRITRNILGHPGKSVLDLGVGTGRLATWLAEGGFEVVGVDLSREMIKKARKKAQFPHRDIDLVLGDVNFLPFRVEAFDCCICINVFNQISCTKALLEEVRSVLKRGGIFVFNFPNLISPYLPIAVLVNLTGHALFKRGRIQSKWFFLREINTLLYETRFKIKELRGCMIVSRKPLVDKLFKVVCTINFLFENSKFRSFSGSLFVKAQLTSARRVACDDS